MVFIIDIGTVDSDENLESSTKEVQYMANIILKLICDGKLP